MIELRSWIELSRKHFSDDTKHKLQTNLCEAHASLQSTYGAWVDLTPQTTVAHDRGPVIRVTVKLNEEVQVEESRSLLQEQQVQVEESRSLLQEQQAFHGLTPSAPGPADVENLSIDSSESFKMTHDVKASTSLPMPQGIPQELGPKLDKSTSRVQESTSQGVKESTNVHFTSPGVHESPG